MKVVGPKSDPAYIREVLAAQSGARAFDIGANGGTVSRVLAESFDEVVACEPAIESYQHLCSNLPQNVVPLNVAVSEFSGEVELEEWAESIGQGELVSADVGLAESGSWGEKVGVRRVRAVTLPELAAEYGDPDFVKIDTEGHEWPIVEGALAYLREVAPRMVVEIHDRDQGEQILYALGAPAQLVRHPYYPPEAPEFHHHYWLFYGI